MNTSHNRNEILYALIIAIALALLASTGPIAQDPAYHDFADQRSLPGIPNFSNVISNIPYLLVGLSGLFVIFRRPLKGGLDSLRMHYILFFAAICLVGPGSAWYHLSPSNSSLLWDRLPITVAFTVFFTAIIGEYYSPRIGRLLLFPLLMAGLLTVLYWYWTEQAGRGDLRPYVLVQFVPMVLLPLVILLRPARFRPAGYLWWMMGFYLLAKATEFYDLEIYNATGAISGHTLKHLFSAAAPVFYILALTRRRPAESG